MRLKLHGIYAQELCSSIEIICELGIDLMLLRSIAVVIIIVFDA